MALSMAKLVDLKWTSKLQNTKRLQVLDRCLAILNRVLSFRKKQEKNGKRPSCSEASVAVEIPDDLVEEILHRLPVRYLLIWRTVSKEWRSLIDSGHLAEKYLRLRLKKYGAEELKLTFEGSSSSGFRIKYFSKHCALGPNNRESESEVLPRVAGSCNGLICLYELVFVSLFNPMTYMTRILAPPQGAKLSVGFGRDVVTGTYKVAVVYSFDNCDNRVETMVFDLSTNEWRWRYKTAGPMPLSFTQISTERNPAFVNGSLFWLLARDHSEILVMDLHTEKFRTVSIPNDIDVSSDSIYMWSLKDRLCVSDLRQSLDSDVWVLVQEEVTERWERTRFAPFDAVLPPLKLNSAWFSQSLVSPYQSSSSDTYRF